MRNACNGAVPCTKLVTRIAWAFDGPDDEIEVISTWPGGGNSE